MAILGRTMINQGVFASGYQGLCSIMVGGRAQLFNDLMDVEK